MSILLTGILVFAALVFLYVLFRFIQDKNLRHLAREHETHANHYEEKITNNPHHINVMAEKEALKIMRKRYLRLVEKFKKDPKMLVEITRDWEHYAHAIFDFVSEKAVFEIDSEDHFGDPSARERFRKRVAASIIQKDKIEERFCKLLGINDISIKYIKLRAYEREE